MTFASYGKGHVKRRSESGERPWELNIGLLFKVDGQLSHVDDFVGHAAGVEGLECGDDAALTETHPIQQAINTLR